MTHVPKSIMTHVHVMTHVPKSIMTHVHVMTCDYINHDSCVTPITYYDSCLCQPWHTSHVPTPVTTPVLSVTSVPDTEVKLTA